MNSSFEYLDIIILAMIAGFIILRLRGILGRRTGHEKKVLGKIVLHVCIFVAQIMLSVCQKAHVTKISQKIQRWPKWPKP